MLENIGAKGFEAISQPDETVIRIAKALCAANRDPVVYEIGVGIGATTLPLAELLANRGTLILFSRRADVDALAADLRKRGHTNVNAEWGSPANTFSGYHFELARGFVSGKLPRFDLAYIDGGHVFHLDAPAACILKELCKPGGYMVFDDWNWSLATSPAMNPKKRPQTAVDYDPMQIAARHVQLVCAAVMDTDARFEAVGVEADSAIYRRRGDDDALSYRIQPETDEAGLASRQWIAAGGQGASLLTRVKRKARRLLGL